MLKELVASDGEKIRHFRTEFRILVLDIGPLLDLQLRCVLTITRHSDFTFSVVPSQAMQQAY